MVIIGEDKSKSYFKKGIKSVFPEARTYPELLNIFYHAVRCGLYHCGITNSQVFVMSDLKGALAFTKHKKVLINPRILVNKLRDYLNTYVENLRNIKNQQLRENFEKRFDFDNTNS